MFAAVFFNALKWTGSPSLTLSTFLILVRDWACVYEYLSGVVLPCARWLFVVGWYGGFLSFWWHVSPCVGSKGSGVCMELASLFMLFILDSGLF